MIHFLSPVFFYGLTALLIPLAIHLWSKSQGKIIKVGSIQLLEETENLKFNSIKLNRIFLWLIRSFIVILLTFLLVGVVMESTSDSRSSVNLVLVEEPLMKDTSVAEKVDSLQNFGWVVKRFEELYPEATDHRNNFQIHKTLNYWSVLKSIEKNEPALKQVIVFSTMQLKNFSGKVPEIRVPVRWLTIPEVVERSFLIEAHLKGEDSLSITYGWSDRMITKVKKETFKKSDELPVKGFDKVLLTPATIPDNYYLKTKEDSVSVTKAKKVKTGVFYSKEYYEDHLYLSAALKTADKYLNRSDLEIIPVDGSDPEVLESCDVIFWLIDAAPEGSFRKDQMIVKMSDHNQLLNEKIIFRDPETGTLWMKKGLNPFYHEMINELPEALIDLFSEDPLEKKIALNDQRVISEHQAKVLNGKEVYRSNPPARKALHLVLWAVLTFLMVIERMMSYRSQH